MLGNKCAGQHNLKTVRSIYPRKAAASFYVMMFGATPYKLFLKVPLVIKQLASSDFTLRRR